MASGIFTLKQQELALGQGAWTNQKPLAVDYLVVAGGGGGGQRDDNSGGGGGGAGGVLQGNIAVSAGSSITVTIGAGGTVAGGTTSNGGNGNNSVFGSMTATGGGGGGQYSMTSAAPSGGSGGGAGRSGTVRTGGQGVLGQGNAGGNATTDNASAGGGGAGTVGFSVAPGIDVGGNGGAGIASDISGTRTTYGGGGGGSVGGGTRWGVGGAGGGGRGASYNNSAGTAGTANTGGGGGGGTGTTYTPGAGGSGIVILSYPDTYSAAASTTGSPTISTSGSGSIFYNNPSVSTYTYMSDNNSFNYGSGDFCVECWVYASSSLTTNYIVSQYLSANKGILLGVGATSSGKISFYYSKTGSDDFQLDDPSSFPTSQWVHVAACRTGNTISLFVAGTRVATRTETGTLYNSTSTIGIGTHIQGLGSNLWPGYITNLRSVAGSNPYDATASTLTVPISPLTRITNTAFLLSAVSGSFLADSSGNNYTLTTVGTPAWNSLSPFATGLGYKNRTYTWTSSGSITF